jgi:hypothetical protein
MERPGGIRLATREKWWTYLRAHRRASGILVVLLVAGAVTASVAVISNVLQYPGNTQVTGQPVVVSALMLGANGTSLIWFVGVAKNVSVSAQPNGYVGNAHIVYEVHATGATCQHSAGANVSLTAGDAWDSVDSCTSTTDLVTFTTGSKYFNGATLYFYFLMTIYQDYGSVSLNIYAVTG